MKKVRTTVREQRRSWKRRLTAILAGIVVFSTTYGLVLPALTLDKDATAEEPGINVETPVEVEQLAVQTEVERPRLVEYEGMAEGAAVSLTWLDPAAEEDGERLSDVWATLDELSAQDAFTVDYAAEEVEDGETGVTVTLRPCTLTEGTALYRVDEDGTYQTVDCLTNEIEQTLTFAANDGAVYAFAAAPATEEEPAAEEPAIEEEPAVGEEPAADAAEPLGDTKADEDSIITLKWTDAQGDKQATVHFVDYDGNPVGGIIYDGRTIGSNYVRTLTAPATLTEMNYDMIKPSFSTAKKTGYTYSCTRLGTWNQGESIRDLFWQNTDSSGKLDVNGTPHVRYQNEFYPWYFYPGQNYKSATTLDSGSDIFVIMSPVPPENTGSDQQDPDLGAPNKSKTMEPNNDGTYDLALSVVGKVAEAKTGANVLFVIDKSSTMGYGEATTTASSNSRLKKLKSILVDGKTVDGVHQPGIIDKLAQHGSETGTAIQFGLITFDKSASNVSLGGANWTGNQETMKSAVSGITLGSGTNWEAAFAKVNSYPAPGNDNPIYVVFFTDGDPTQYVGHIVGTSNARSSHASMYPALSAARKTVNLGYQLYGIFAYGTSDSVTNGFLKTLINFAYNDSNAHEDYLWIASPLPGTNNSESYPTVEEAIEGIANLILKKYTFTDVAIHDGITDMTTQVAIAGNFEYQITYTDAQDHTLHTVPITVNGDGSITIPAVTYHYLNDKNEVVEKTTEAVTITGAVYSQDANGHGSVDWHLAKTAGDGTYYKLEPGWKYQVSFPVWPSQDTYDILAAIRNGEITFNDPNATWKGEPIDWSQFKDAENLYTNTSASVTYRQITQTNGVDGEPSEQKSAPIPEKPYMELLPTKLRITKEWIDDLTDGEDRPNPLKLMVTSDGEDYVEVELTPNDWTAEVYIAPGIYVTPGDYDSATTGDNAGVLETGHVYSVREVNAPHYELDVTPVHPMLDGTTKNTTVDMFDKTTGTRWNSGTALLTATNTVKGGIEISKVVTTKDDHSDSISVTDSFTIKIDLEDENGDPVSTVDYNGSASNGGGELGYRIFTRVNGGDDVERARGNIVNGTVTLSITTDEYIRIVNMPTGTKYTVTEVSSSIPAGYALLEITNSTGTVTPNSSASITVYNKLTLGQIEISKVVTTKDDHSDSIPVTDPFTVVINLKDASNKPVSTVDFNGNGINDGTELGYRIYTRVSGGDDTLKSSGAITNGTATLTIAPNEYILLVNVPVGTKYTVTETPVPAGYTLLDIVNATGTVNGTEKVEITIYNKMTLGQIDISKVVTNSENHADVKESNDSFTMVINLKDGTNKPVSSVDFNGNNTPDAGELAYRIYTRVTGGDDLLKESGFIVNGTATLSITPAEYIQIVNIPTGTSYTVTETPVPTNYECWDVVNGTGTVSGSGTVSVTVYNKLLGFSLPHTGGNGIYLFTLGGMFCMTAAVIYGIGLRRRRERRAK